MSLPLGLLRKVEAHLGDYLSHKPRFNDTFGNSFSRSSSSGSIATDEGLFEQLEPLGPNRSVMEKILARRNFQLREQQEAWQVRFTLSGLYPLPAHFGPNASLSDFSIFNGIKILCRGEDSFMQYDKARFICLVTFPCDYWISRIFCHKTFLFNGTWLLLICLEIIRYNMLGDAFNNVFSHSNNDLEPFVKNMPLTS